jgi:hypothetical protein
MYLNYAQHQRAAQDEKLLQGTIGDLKYQVEQDHLASNSSSTPDPTPSPSASPSPEAVPSPSPSTAVLDASAAAKTATIKTPGNIHAAMSTKSASLVKYTQVTAGATVTLVGDKVGSWQKITFNGVTGYIANADLQY